MIKFMKRHAELLFVITVLASCLLTLPMAKAAEANCYFNSGTGDQILSLNGIGKIDAQGSVSQATQIGKGEGYAFGHTGSVCESGSNGGSTTLWYKNGVVSASAGEVKSAQGESTPLFATSVPGIAYTLQAVSNTGISVYVRPGTSASWQSLGGYSSSQLDGATWRYIAKLYQLPEYKAGVKERPVVSMATLASFNLGDATQESRSVNLKSGQNSLGMLMSSPTCTSAIIAPAGNVSGSVLNLGDYHVSDLNEMNDRTVPFEIGLSGCSGVRAVVVSVTTSNTVYDQYYIGPNPGSGGSGLGVRIGGAGNITFKPNDSTSFAEYSGTNLVAVTDSSYLLELRAFLHKVNDGQQIKAGEKFEATMTFNITYE